MSREDNGGTWPIVVGFWPVEICIRAPPSVDCLIQDYPNRQKRERERKKERKRDREREKSGKLLFCVVKPAALVCVGSAVDLYDLGFHLPKRIYARNSNEEVASLTSPGVAPLSLIFHNHLQRDGCSISVLFMSSSP